MSHRNPAPMGADRADARAAAARANVPDMSDALRRYPNIREEERQQLLQFLKHGAQEDIVRATYVAGLEPRLFAFRKHPPEHFPGLRSWLPFALIILITVLGILWRILF